MSTATMETAKPSNRWPNDESLFEIIDGIHVELPPMSFYAVQVASEIHFALRQYLEMHPIGRAIVEGLFHLPLPMDRNRRPDVAFVSYERWPEDRLLPQEGNSLDVAPDLVIEVISPSDLLEETTIKIQEYFRAGVQSIWIVQPIAQTIFQFTAADQVTVLSSDKEISGGTILPQFHVPVRKLFPNMR